MREIAEIVGGELHGPADLRIARPVLSGSNDPEGITFAGSAVYLAIAENSGVGAVLVGRDAGNASKPHVLVESSWKAYCSLLRLSERPLPLGKGIHPTAVVDPEAQVDPGASVGPFVVVARRARIGAGARIYPFCYVGENCKIGNDCVLYPHVVLYQDVTLGDKTIVHSGAVLGADGFRYDWDGRQRVKIPQVGGVEIGPNSEIGANTAIDRAMADQTTLGEGVKVDNLVQIAHNVQIGEHSAIAGLTGIAGSAKIGKRVVMAGAVTVRDHVTVADDVVLAGKAGVESDIKHKGTYLGFPVMPGPQALRVMALFMRLPELFSRLRKLERTSAIPIESEEEPAARL